METLRTDVSKDPHFAPISVRDYLHLHFIMSVKSVRISHQLNKMLKSKYNI